MSTAGSATTDVHYYSIDSNQNYSIKSEESVNATMKNDQLSVDPSQFGRSVAATRKGSFVITDIRQHDEELDDVDQPTACEVSEMPKRPLSSDEKSLSWVSAPEVDDVSSTDSNSRFRIVKIESRDRWHRGRWTCHDFADPPEHVKTEQTVESDDGTSSMSRNGPPIYYIPGVQDALRSPFGIVYSSGGHPILEPNLLPSSPRYARGSRFFSDRLPTPDAVQSDVTRMQLSSQRISAVDQREPVGPSAARKLLFNKFVPLRVSVSESLQNDTEDTKVESLISRQISNTLLMTADVQNLTAGQTSPLDAMMSARLGSSSEPDLRSAVICLPVFY